MLDQNTFMETVREVSEIIRTSDKPLTKEQILDYFTDMELNEEQQELVFTYLITPHEEPVQPEEEPETEAEAEPENQPEEAETSEKENGQILPDSKVFSMYLEELQQIPAYSEQELDKLYEKLLSGDETVISDLSGAWLKQVLELAKELAMSSEDFEDIVQEGNMSLFLKLTELCGVGEVWNTSKASETGSFRKWAEQELTEAIKLAMQAGITELAGEDDSENAMLGKINLVNEARKYLAEENGAEPTAAELAAYTKMSEEELTDILLMIRKADEKK